jgi:osmoprotectant transport system substrate-binding protein
MKRRPRYVLARLALAVAGVLALSACGGGNPLDTGPAAGPPAPSDTIKIGSADFVESQLLASIYAEALRAKGVKVTQTPPIGSRETYIPALRDGSIDLIPEYTGTLLQYFDPRAPQTAPDEVYPALRTAVPAPLIVLDRSAAEDKDAVVVTRQTATRYQATSIADLAPACGELVFGGPPEFKTRPDGIPGLRRTYGCNFKSYVSLDAGGPLTLSALRNNQVQAADVFTTDPAIAENDLIALDDPRHNFAAQNVVPLINSAKASALVRQALDAISAKLTTSDLLALRRRLNAPDRPNPAAVAGQWLSQKGLG